MNMAMEQSLKLAVEHHTGGRLAEAEALYRQVLQADPDQPVALHLLGVLAHQTGHNGAAVELISKAISIKPDYPEAHNNLGLSLQGQGQLDGAAASYQRAISLKPDYPEAHNNLGNAALQLGQTQGAVESYRQAIAIKPDYLKAHNNLGLALRDLGKLDQAIESYHKAIAIKPDYHEALSNLGNALADQGKLEQAVACLNKAIAANPAHPAAHNNLGLVWLNMGKVDQAEASFHAALAINPNDAPAHNNLGLALQSRGHQQQAAGQFSKAIAINPNDAQAHNNLGNAYKELGQLEEAIAAYRQALNVQPQNQHAAVNLLHQLRHACAWPEIEAIHNSVNAFTKRAIQAKGPITLSPFDSVISSDDVAENLAVARSRSRQIAARMSGLKTNFEFSRQQKTPITIGYLSSDFQNHATAHLMLSLFKLHDRDHFRVISFSYGQDDGTPYRQTIINDSDQFVDLQNADHRQAAQAIHGAGVDILIDLKGHTQNSRLEICAARPAPLQVSYLGFPGTSGADFMDYIITDRVVTPADQAPCYSERFVYLPHCYQVNDQQQEISRAAISRADFGLPENAFVFCSFNSNFKIEPLIFQVWMALLKQVSGSVLWLYKSNELALANLKNQAQSQRVDPDRLIFASHLPKDQHLARHQLADLALDTRLCGGHTTTSDALWAGLPVVTMIGCHFASRVSASLLGAVGLPELIVEDLDAYEVLALKLSQHPEQLENLKTKLALNRLSQPLFDTRRFVKNLERAYRSMWDTYVSGQPAAIIEVTEP